MDPETQQKGSKTLKAQTRSAHTAGKLPDREQPCSAYKRAVGPTLHPHSLSADEGSYLATRFHRCSFTLPPFTPLPSSPALPATPTPLQSPTRGRAEEEPAQSRTGNGRARLLPTPPGPAPSNTPPASSPRPGAGWALPVHVGAGLGAEEAGRPSWLVRERRRGGGRLAVSAGGRTERRSGRAGGQSPFPARRRPTGCRP